MKRAGWNLLEKRTLSSVSNERWHLHGKVIVVKVAVQQPDFSFLTSVDRPPSWILDCQTYLRTSVDRPPSWSLDTLSRLRDLLG